MWKLECALIAILQSYKLCRLDYVQLEDKIGYIKSLICICRLLTEHNPSNKVY